MHGKRNILCLQSFIVVSFMSAVCSSQENLNSPATRDVIPSVERFYGLSDEEARDGRPVHIEGVVLYSDPAWQLFWLQDETGRLFLPISPDTKAPLARTRAIVTGKTTLANGVRTITDLKIREVAKAELPPPLVLLPLKLEDKLRLQGRVSLTGTVVEAEFRSKNHIRLVVAFLRRFQVQVTINNCQEKDLIGLLGAEIEAIGCASPLWNQTDTQLLSQQVFVPDLSDLTVFKSGPVGPFAVPVIPIEALEIERRQRRDPRLIRVYGKVAEQPTSDVLRIKKGSTTVDVHLKAPVELTNGSDVEVIGIAWLDEDKNIFIDRGTAKAATLEDAPEEDQRIDLPILATAQALHGLTRQMARQKYPVEIEGIVMYYDPGWRVMFVHDGIRGVYVDEKRRAHSLRPGDRVIVRGVSDPGGFAPMVIASSIQKHGRGELPAPRAVSFGRLLSGAEDSQWVTLGGVIQSVERSQKNLVLSMRNSEGDFEAVICGAGKLLKQKNWPGSAVTLTGVCGTKSDAGFQATGIYFHVPSADHVAFQEEAPSDPFAIPVTSVSDLATLEPGAGSARKKVKISGVVTYVDPSGLVAMQDESRGILIRFKTKDTPQVHDVIDIIGLPLPEQFSPTLRVSAWQKTGIAENSPAPTPIRVADIQSAEMDGQLVLMEATVLRNSSSSAAPGLTLQGDGVVFSADLASVTTAPKWAGIRDQSVVRLQGVLDIRSDDWDRMRSFRLLCPTTSHLEIVRPAPWWTSRHTLVLVSALTILVLMVLAWGIALRSTVARQTSRIEQELAVRGALTTQYNTLVENAGELIFSISQSCEFVAVNPATERVFDEPNDRLLGQQITDHLSEESVEVLNLVVSRLTSGQPHAVLELTTSRGIVLETAVHLETQNPQADELQCIARDVSERRRLERQIRQMQKMDSVGQLAAGVAHDYNNLLTVVRMNSEMLLASPGLAEDKVKSVSLIHDAAARAATLTQQLLAFSRRQAMNTTLIQPGELLSDITEILRRLISEDIELRLTVDEAVQAIHADGGMIQQAIMNLALNARDAMPTGGVLEISVRSVTISPEVASQHVEMLPGKYVEISVTDDGCGIDKDTQLNIFEPFYTTKEVGKGTGLGLSTVFGIAKQHEGWVDVQSTVGDGSRFAVFLPEVQSVGVKRPETVAKVQSPVSSGRETILIVEDDSSVRLTMSKVLERAGHQVVQSINGPEALEIWNRMGSSIDLVITDMVMPGGMTGTELAQEIKASNPSIPIIYCTGYSSELMHTSLLSDSERLLPKPFEGTYLIREVQELLGIEIPCGQENADGTATGQTSTPTHNAA